MHFLFQTSSACPLTETGLPFDKKSNVPWKPAPSLTTASLGAIQSGPDKQALSVISSVFYRKSFQSSQEHPHGRLQCTSSPLSLSILSPKKKKPLASSLPTSRDSCRRRLVPHDQVLTWDVIRCYMLFLPYGTQKHKLKVSRWKINNDKNTSRHYRTKNDRLCGLVVRVSGYRYRGPRFDPRSYQIFWVVVGLERGPLSPVRSNWGATWIKK